MAEKNKFPIVMKSTAAATAILTAVLFTVHHFLPFQGILVAAITVFTTCYHFSMRLLVGFLVPKCIPQHNPGNFFFRLYAFEPKLYSLLRVKKWKSNMPTYAPATFDPKLHSWEEIAQALCQAEIIHEVIAVLSFLPLLAAIPFGALGVFVITSVISALYDLSFVIMQRYNRPRILKLIKKESVAK